MVRKKIKPEEKINVRMTVQDKQLLLDHTSADPEYAESLESIPGSTDLLGQYTLDDLEDMLGCIAIEANHAEDAILRRKLYELFNRLHKIQRSYDDGNWNDSEKA